MKIEPFRRAFVRGNGYVFNVVVFAAGLHFHTPEVAGVGVAEHLGGMDGVRFLRHIAFVFVVDIEVEEHDLRFAHTVGVEAAAHMFDSVNVDDDERQAIEEHPRAFVAVAHLHRTDNRAFHKVERVLLDLEVPVGHVAAHGGGAVGENLAAVLRTNHCQQVAGDDRGVGEGDDFGMARAEEHAGLERGHNQVLADVDVLGGVGADGQQVDVDGVGELVGECFESDEDVALIAALLVGIFEAGFNYVKFDFR